MDDIKQKESLLRTTMAEMDAERVRAYLQVACAGLGFEIGEVWWTSSANGHSTVASIGKSFHPCSNFPFSNGIVCCALILVILREHRRFVVTLCCFAMELYLLLKHFIAISSSAPRAT